MGGKPVTKRDELVGGEPPMSHEPPMNYSATSTITFHFLTLLVSGPGRPLSLKGDEGESDRR